MKKIILGLLLCAMILSGCKLAYFNEELIQEYQLESLDVQYSLKIDFKNDRFKDGILSTYLEFDSNVFLDFDEILVITQNGKIVAFSINDSRFQKYYKHDFTQLHHSLNLKIQTASFHKDESVEFQFLIFNQQDYETFYASNDNQCLYRVMYSYNWNAPCDYLNINESIAYVEQNMTMSKQSNYQNKMIELHYDLKYFETILNEDYIPYEYVTKAMFCTDEKHEITLYALIDFNQYYQDSTVKPLYLSAYIDYQPVLINKSDVLAIDHASGLQLIQLTVQVDEKIKTGKNAFFLVLSDGFAYFSDIYVVTVK